MPLDFVALASLLRVEDNAPYKEIVGYVRERFPGRGHAFDPFIEQIGPLATGFVSIPSLSDSGRSAKIRYWLNEAAQGRGQNFKPVLLRWLWTYDEKLMRGFLYRWGIALHWTEEQLSLPPTDRILDTSPAKTDLLIGHGEGANIGPLLEIKKALTERNIIVDLCKIAHDVGDVATHLSRCSTSVVSVFYSCPSSYDYRLNRDGNFELDVEFAQTRSYFLKASKRLLILKEGFDSSVTYSKDGSKPGFLEMPSGIDAVSMSLEQSVRKARLGDDAFNRFYQTLLEKNAGQQFLERGLSARAECNPEGISLTLFDIDMTNQINRKFGDEIGDMVIESVQSFLMQALTEYEPLDFGRCGDDTFFAALYDGFDRRGTMSNLNRQIANPGRWESVPGLRVTCSAGYASRKPNEAIIDVVIKAALGLEAARSAGGNTLKLGPDRISNSTSRYIRHHFS